MKRQTPTLMVYRGDPKKYVSLILDAIDQGNLTYDGVANCEQTIRALASVLDVVNSKNDKTLSVESLVTYGKKERSGEFTEYSEGNFRKIE